MSETEFARLANAFDAELVRSGLKISAQEKGTQLVLTISRNQNTLLAIIEIHSSEGERKLIEPIGRVSDLNLSPSRTSLRIHKEIILDQDKPILDVESQDDFKHARVLGLSEVALYKDNHGRWEQEDLQHLPLSSNTQRSLSGSLEPGVDQLTARLTGWECAYPYLAPDQAKWSCRAAQEEAKPPQMNAVEVWGKKTPPWLAAATFEADGRTEYLIIGQDGIARLYEDTEEAVATFSGWGSQLASFKNPCGSGWLLLTSGTGDWSAADTVTGFEFSDRKPISITNPLDFPGPILLLRTSSNMPNLNRIVAVVRNLQSGKYEVYGLSIDCTN